MKIVNKNYDVIVVGSGVAGLYCALNLKPDAKILLLCKRQLTLSNSSLAQGGVAAVLDETHDSIASHQTNTLLWPADLKIILILLSCL